MIRPRPTDILVVPAVRRLDALAPLDQGAVASLVSAFSRPRRYAATRQVLAEGAVITETLLIVDGWAARQRIMPDGRLLLELLERLELAGLATDGRIVLPLTQEMIGDALGLTAVHVNRTLQALRRDGAIDLKLRDLIVHDAGALRGSIGRSVTRVSAG